MKFTIGLVLIVFVGSVSQAHSHLGSQSVLLDSLKKKVSISNIGPNFGSYRRGEFQIIKIGEKFASVFTNSGDPIAIYDLTLPPLSQKELYLGAFGIGDLNIRNLLKLVKNSLSAGKEASALADNPDDPNDSPPEELTQFYEKLRIDALDGDKAFSKIRLTDTWALSNHIEKRDQKPGVPLPEGASFSLNDLQFNNNYQKENFLKTFSYFMNVVETLKYWDRTNIEKALNEFQFRYIPKQKGYEIIWDRSQRSAVEDNPVPLSVVDFSYLTKNHDTKIQLLRNAQSLLRLVDKTPLKLPLSIVICQIAYGQIERLEYHERRLIGLLESMERFEYQGEPLPKGLIEVSLELLYLNGINGGIVIDASSPKLSTRSKNLNYEDVASGLVLAKLKKLLSSDLKFETFAGTKFIVIREKQTGTLRSIVSAAIKPSFLFQYVAKHVDGRSMTKKWLERELVTAAATLATGLLPTSFFFKLVNSNIGITIEPMIFQVLIRSQMDIEKIMEGELASLVDETIAGKTTLPLSHDELLFVQKSLRKSLVNPYELKLEEEGAAMKASLEALKERFGIGQNADLML